ncbi:MAG: dehydrogenase, partial [Fibrobacteres bacterium]|nr:dehydrogenase [Fibrobacterota bacterium]
MTAVQNKPAIIGFGPAGIFAALELIERGEKPVIFERGRKLEERHIDIKEFIKNRNLNTESNIQFGEGGAGSYSDGKLFSRVNNTKHADKVLKTFIKFGAPEEIATIRKPHLGTDLLCEIVMRMRKYIQENGGEIYYNSKLTDISIRDGVLGYIEINGQQTYKPSRLFLAIGNSPRDTFEMIYNRNISIEAKPITVGVRLEHPSALIKKIRNGV